MSSMAVPKIVIQAIDRRRRAFFWTGEDKCHGSKCLVAWDTLQLSKKHGGLGVKDLELQNRCLLMKFVDKLFADSDTPWKRWILDDTPSYDVSTENSDGFIWKIINDELSTYRSLTVVKLHNGASTSFWLDEWLPDGPLYLTHAALFSHATRPNVSVQKVFQANFDMCLRPRLTNVASVQLAGLLSKLQELQLDDLPDQRLMKLTSKAFTVRDAYRALNDGHGEPEVHGQRIWGSRVPNKVKIFSWLYFKDRLSTRANLCSKNILRNDCCERCHGGIEDRHRVFFGCAKISGVWTKLGLTDIATLDDLDIWNAEVSAHLDEKVWPFVLQAILWHLWDARNNAVFRHETPMPRSIITLICDDLVIWRNRYKKDPSVCMLDGGRSYFLSCNGSD